MGHHTSRLRPKSEACPRPTLRGLAKLSPLAILGLCGLGCTSPLLPAPDYVQAQRLRDNPVAGSQGLGDPYFPELGNGGYQVEHYDLALDVDMETDQLDGTAKILAEVTTASPLASFSLDFSGLIVQEVLIGEVAAKFTREANELLIEPATPLEAGSQFLVTIRYTGRPLGMEAEGIPIDRIGWVRFDSGVLTLSEPNGSESWYPVNDHPLDKATYDFRITVDDPWVVAANGLLIDKSTKNGRSHFHFRASDPMASYLTTVNIGKFEIVKEEGPGGLPLTHYYPVGVSEATKAKFDVTVEQIEFFSKHFGPYPFECFGAVVSDEYLGGALETQTLPVYGRRGRRDSTIAHELAHQWFGNSVSPASWKDIWLNESFAEYAAWMWVRDHHGEEAFERNIKRAYIFCAREGTDPVDDPGRLGLFGIEVYMRGPLALHVLRLHLGDEMFLRILNAWLERFRNSSASTADFIQLAEEISNESLAGWRKAWLQDRMLKAIPELGLEPRVEKTGDK